MIGQLAYHPQVAVGVYLAVGGGLLFAAAALLAAYRESILSLPDAIERRHGSSRSSIGAESSANQPPRRLGPPVLTLDRSVRGGARTCAGIPDLE